MPDPVCDCGGFSLGGIHGHWDNCATQYPDRPRAYLISQQAADNVLAFEGRHGRKPKGVTETLAAMLHGAETDLSDE